MYLGLSEDDAKWARVFNNTEDDENGDWSGRHLDYDLTHRGRLLSIESREDPI